jgi:hypothetical protein
MKVYMSDGVDRTEPSTADPSKIGAVLLEDGTRLEADLVILGVGVPLLRNSTTIPSYYVSEKQIPKVG